MLENTNQFGANLLQERDFIEAVLNTVDSLVVVIDRAGRIVRFNQACERATGYRFEDVRGENYAELFLLPEEAASVNQVVEELLSGKYPNRFENHWITKDGQRRRVAWSNTVLIDKQGQVAFIVATGIDVTEQRLAEAALQDSEARYSNLFNNHHTPMLLIDPANAQIIKANPAACQFYGWSKEQLEQFHITDINILPSDKTRQNMGTAQAAPGSHIFFFQHRLANGDIRDVEVHSGPIRVSGKEYLFSIIHDITERKRIEKEIENISRFPEENPNPVFRFTREGQILYANRASKRLLACWERQVGEQVPQRVLQTIHEIAASGQEKEIEVECEDHIYLLLFIDIPQAEYVNAYGRDITFRKRLTEENRRQKDLLNLLFQYDPGGLALLSGPEFTFRYTNPAYRRMSPRPELDLIGHTYNEIWPASEGFMGLTYMTEVMQTGEQMHLDRLMRKFPDGSTHYFSFHVFRIDWEGERAIFLVLWNTTELEIAKHSAEVAAAAAAKAAGEAALAAAHAEQRALEAEEARRHQEALTKKLQRANQELQDFAYIASHDLQEPLRKIQAFGERLQHRYAGDLGEEAVDYLRRMTNAANRMSTMIRGLLDYSRVTTQAQPLALVRLNKVVDGVLSDLEVRLEQSGVQVIVDPLPTVLADPTQMRLLFQNLIGNALKFQDPARPPRLYIYGEVLLLDTERSPYAEITVEDNGIGFDVRYLDRIMQPFQRLHGQNEYEGNGMGLAICRKIVERHGGKLTARSTIGVGTAFVVTLPVQMPA